MSPELEPNDELTDDELDGLAQLVDGTLPPVERADVEARVTASPRLARMADRQAAAVNALRSTADICAPARLRATVERRGRIGRAGARRPMRSRFAGAIATASAVAVALIAILPGALSSGLSVAEAAALAHKPPSETAPGVVPRTPQLLRAKVAGVPFPNYSAKFGWKPVGARRDEPSGRSTTTVYYQKGVREIAYTIVSGHALTPPSHARSTTRGGVEYRAFRAGGRAIVTWERNGHTCVLSGSRVRGTELITLANWRGKGTIPF